MSWEVRAQVPVRTSWRGVRTASGTRQVSQVPSRICCLQKCHPCSRSSLRAPDTWGVFVWFSSRNQMGLSSPTPHLLQQTRCTPFAERGLEPEASGELLEEHGIAPRRPWVHLRHRSFRGRHSRGQVDRGGVSWSGRCAHLVC